MADRSPHTTESASTNLAAEVEATNTPTDHNANLNIDGPDILKQYEKRINELARKLDGDQLIISMREFEDLNGLKKKGLKGWRDYFRTNLGDCGLSESTFYHYGDITDYSIFLEIKLNSDTLRPLRAICKIPEKGGIRNMIWKKASEGLSGELPSPKTIQDTYTAFKEGQQHPVDKIFDEITNSMPPENLDAYRQDLKMVSDFIKYDKYKVTRLHCKRMQDLVNRLDRYALDRGLNFSAPDYKHPETR